MSAGNAARATAMPATAPQTASTACSVISCRIKRPRDAPSAVRSAISPTRSIDRPSTSVPRFTAASIRINPTAPSRIKSAGRTSPVIASCSCLHADRLAPVDSVAPRSLRIAGASSMSSRVAASGVTPGASLRDTLRERGLELRRCPASTGSGAQRSVPGPKTSKPAGITPMIVCGS